MGSTLSAIIRIRNLTNSDITSITIYDVDSFDFGTCKPDKAFNGLSIPASGCIERAIDLSPISSSCPFTTKLVFKNGTEDVFRTNYKRLFNSYEAHVKHLTRTHHLQLKKTGPRVLEIIVENTQEQLDNCIAEQLINQGLKLMKLGEYEKAFTKFATATHKANEKGTILALQWHSHKLKSIKENAETDRVAKAINNEGLRCLKLFKFQDAVVKFEDALRFAKNQDTSAIIEDNLKIAKDARANQEAKKLNQEGLYLRKNNKNEIAIMKFEEALRTATDSNLIHSIKINKSETLNRAAKETLNRAWIHEMSSTEDAIHLFAKAKFLFQQAETVKPNPENQQHVKLIEQKMEGSKNFNTAVQLQNEGAQMVEKSFLSNNVEDFKMTKLKYEEAWKYYNQARKIFDDERENNVNFEYWFQLTSEAIDGTERILNELEEIVT